MSAGQVIAVISNWEQDYLSPTYTELFGMLDERPPPRGASWVALSAFKHSYKIFIFTSLVLPYFSFKYLVLPYFSFTLLI